MSYFTIMESNNLPHDAAYKTFFSDPEMVKSFLLNFVPEDFVADFDFDTLEPCNGSYTTVNLSQRQNDVVWRLRWKDNTWCYIYLMLEFQSSQDRWMPLRILSYTALLWEDLIKKGLIKSGEALPPIFPLVIYTGSSPWNAARDIYELLAKMPQGLAEFQPSQKYFLLDVGQLRNSDMDKAHGIAALLFRLERAKTKEEILAICLEVTRNLPHEKYSHFWLSITQWIKCVAQYKLNLDNFNPAEKEGEAMLAERFAQWNEELIQQGIQQGRAEGISEGLSLGRAEGIYEGLSQELVKQQSTLIDMLTDRFGEIQPTWQSDIIQVKEADALRNLIRAVYRVANADEFSDLLQGCSKVQ